MGAEYEREMDRKTKRLGERHTHRDREREGKKIKTRRKGGNSEVIIKLMI